MDSEKWRLVHLIEFLKNSYDFYYWLVLTFSSKLDRASYIVSVAKTASEKIGALILSIKFLFLEVAFCLCNFTVR